MGGKQKEMHTDHSSQMEQPPRDRKPLQTNAKKKNPRQQTETEKWIQRLTLCVFACECCLCAGVMGSVLLFSVLYFVYLSIFA